MNANSNGFSFPKTNRLLKAAEFQRVFDGVDCKQGGKHLTFLSASNNHSCSRLGIIVAKKQVALAVSRNRIKRQIRETFRRLQPQIQQLKKQFDVIVIVRASAGHIENSKLSDELQTQWSKFLSKRQTVL